MSDETQPRKSPVLYDPKFAPIAAKMCQLGATDTDLAEAFGCNTRTVDKWKVAHPEFLEALTLGKDPANNRVERSLYQRANGYSHPDTKIFLAKDGTVVEHEYVKHIPPDTVACIFWLKNRRPDQWRDKLDIDQHTRPADASEVPMTADEWDRTFGSRRAN